MVASESISMDREKKCRLCGEFKPEAHFSRNIRSADGLGYRCRKCNSERSRKVRADVQTMGFNVGVAPATYAGTRLELMVLLQVERGHFRDAK